MAATQGWLKQILTPYQSADRVFRDTIDVLQCYIGLSPKTDAYTNELGITAVLLCLHGTIPIAYKNVTYNIPIAIWIPYVYPASPPIPFVQPTSNMLIRNGKHVDLEGKIYHPYLAYWHTSPDQQSVKGLLSILQSIFQQEPPVYAKPAQSSVPIHQQLLQSSYQLYHNTGSIGQSQQQMPAQQLDSSQPPPTYTPLATLYNNNSYIQPQQNDGSNYTSLYNNASQDRPALSASTTNNNQMTNRNIRSKTASSLTNDEENVRLASLRSMVTDKLARVQREQSTIKMEALFSTNRQLLDGWTKINDVLRRLYENDQKIDQNIGILDAKIKELSQLLESVKNTPKTNVDDIVTGSNTLHNQLFEVVADDHAIDDTLYCLREAFGLEKIDHNSYLKHVRALAREQFLKRALIKKIRAIAKLPT